MRIRMLNELKRRMNKHTESFNKVRKYKAESTNAEEYNWNEKHHIKNQQ